MTDILLTEPPSLVHLVSLQSLLFYEAGDSEYLTGNILQPFSQLNDLLPASLKQLQFELILTSNEIRSKVFGEKNRRVWGTIDRALSDPKLRNLQHFYISNRDRYILTKATKDPEVFLQESLPRTFKRGILRWDDYLK